MKNFEKKWIISASSGILGRILLVILCLGAGFVGSQYISVPIDKDIIVGAGLVIGVVAILFTAMICVYFPEILEWFAYGRESETERIKLKSENLQLENENLKLKLELQEKQSHNEE